MNEDERKASVYDAYLYNMSPTEIALYAREAQAELTRLRSLAARVDNVEGMAKVLFEEMNPGCKYEYSSIKGMWEAQARAIVAWLKEGEK